MDQQKLRLADVIKELESGRTITIQPNYIDYGWKYHFEKDIMTLTEIYTKHGEPSVTMDFPCELKTAGHFVFGKIKRYLGLANEDCEK